MKLLCLLLCVYLSILTTLKWFIKDEDFDGFTQFDGSTHTDTDELTQSETYIPMHLRNITDITNQLNLSATQGNVWYKLVKKLNMIDKSIALVPVPVLILGTYGLTTYLKENKGRKEQREERS